MSQSKILFGSNINLIKSHNLRAILQALLLDEHLSRVELAEKLSLSNTTITNLTSELLQQEVIIEEQVENPGKRRGVGRPRKMLRLIPSARYSIGVHIGVGIYRVAVTDLFAKIIFSEIATFDLSALPENVLEDIAKNIKNSIQASKIDQNRLIGIGVGASGLVNFGEGINVLAPRLGWVNVPIQNLLQSQLGIPVCVDNNVRTMALAEAFFGDGQGVDLLAFVYGRIGVGSGIVVKGQVFRGSGAGAGEIGHSTIIPKGGEICTCGNTGCLETLLSEPVWVQHIKGYTAKNPDSIVATCLQNKNSQSSLECIFSAARKGDIKVKEYIEDQACYLGIALANLVNILNPELIILGGMFSQGSDLILPIAESKMRSAAFAGLGDQVKLTTTSFGWRAGVIGAAALALTNFFYQNIEGN